MFKQLIRWILPFVALLLIVTVLLFTTIVSNSHAAGTPTHHAPVVSTTPTSAPQLPSPDIFYRGG